MRNLILLLVCMLGAWKSNCQITPEVRKKIDSLFAGYTSSTPGCALMIVKNGEVFYEKYAGMSNLEHAIPVDSTSPFHIASLSKQVTAAAIYKLVMENRIALTDDIRKYLPELPDFGHNITINHLIHHSSGLRDQWWIQLLSGWRPNDLVTEEDILNSLKRQRRLNFAPGSEFMYSNTGYTLLGLIIRKVTGLTLREYADAVFFRPLGMRHTHFQSDHASIIKNRTAAYIPDGTGGWKIEIPVFDTYGATSLFTTVRDFATWEKEFYYHAGKDAGLLKMIYSPGRLNDGSDQLYAGGLMIDHHRGYKLYEHGGADAGYRSFMLRIPELQTSIILLSNRADFYIDAYYLLDVISGGIVKEDPPAFSADSTELKNWEAVFFDVVSQEKIAFTRKGNKLMIGWWELTAVDNHTFRAGPYTLFSFTKTGSRVSVVKSDEGSNKKYFTKITPGDGRVTESEDLKGKYYCSELNVFYELSFVDGKMFMEIPRNGNQELKYIGENIYEGESDTFVTLIRNRDKRITGFNLSAGGRVRNLLFERVNCISR